MQKNKIYLPDYPIVSVIIPTYNYAPYITVAVDSILVQEFPLEKIEIIVVDDGSTDNTKEVLEKYIQSKTLKYFWQPNKGKASATYKAIQESTGKYIFNLDADDYFLSGKIKQTVQIFESSENIVHVASPAQFFDEEKQINSGIENISSGILEKSLDGKRLLNHFYNNNILFGGGSTYTARSSALKKIIIPPEVDMYIDEFLLLTILPFGNSYFIRSPLSVWRMHKLNYSGKFNNLEERIKKAKRLLYASAAVKKYLEENFFDKKLIKIYQLKDLNRNIAFKESTQTKKLKDVFRYAHNVFFKIKPGLKLIKKYQVLNRLLPLKLYSFLKKQFNF